MKPQSAEFLTIRGEKGFVMAVVTKQQSKINYLYGFITSFLIFCSCLETKKLETKSYKTCKADQITIKQAVKPHAWISIYHEMKVAVLFLA